MRILAITNLYPNPLQPHRGTFNRQQFRALSQRHDLRVIAPIAWSDELAAPRDVVLPKSRSVVCDGIQVYHPRYVFPPRVMRSWYGKFFRNCIKGTFVRLLKEFRPDLIFAAWAYPDGWAAADLAQEAGLPLVLKVHGSDILTLPKLPGRAHPTAEAVRRSDWIIAVSEDLSDKVIRMGARPDHVSVVYDGIDSDLFYAGSQDASRERIGIVNSDPTILFVGNLVPVKGIDVLLRACSELAARGVAFHAYLIGHGPLREALQRQIHQLGMENRVSLLGPKPHATLPDWYRAADVFVLPSHSEGVPCVLLEAAACQTPFVASRVGGIPEIASLNEGEMVPPGDSSALADAIERRLLTPWRAGRTGGFARSHTDAAADIEAVFECVLHSTSAPPRKSTLMMKGSRDEALVTT